MTALGPCHLCSQIAGDPSGDLLAQMLPTFPYVRRVVTESGSFAAIPSLGALADGHVLLCAKEHVRSFAALPVRLDAEYQEIRSELRSTLATTYEGEVHIFEHGAARTGDRIPCTIDHAHVHLVPAAPGIALDLSAVASWTAFDGSLAALAEGTGGQEYLRYEAPDGERRFAVADDRPFESQFMSRAFANAVGRPSTWDWRTAPVPLAAHHAWERLTPR